MRTARHRGLVQTLVARMVARSCPWLALRLTGTRRHKRVRACVAHVRTARWFRLCLVQADLQRSLGTKPTKSSLAASRA